MQTTSVSSKAIEEILARLDNLTKEVRVMRSKLFDKEPSYGSDEWWEWSDKKAMEDIKRGRYTEIKNKKELKTFLNSLK